MGIWEYVIENIGIYLINLLIEEMRYVIQIVAMVSEMIDLLFYGRKYEYVV